jgi:hypothetical protein
MAEINGVALAPWRLHDIRRTVATGLQRLGVGLQVVESVLGHVSGSRAGVVGVYQRHRFGAEQRQALEAWAGEVARIAGSSTHLASAIFAGAGSQAATGGLTMSAGATFTGAGSLMADVRPIDMRWVEAVGQADRTRSFDPMIEYLRLPDVQGLGQLECFWLRELLEQVQFRRKKRGRSLRLGQKSRKEILETGAALVRELQRVEKRLTREAAIDRVVGSYPPGYFGDINGEKLANFMKRAASSPAR